MHTTADFLNQIREKYGLKSNYALARKLGQTDTSIARWAHGKGSFSDETCLQVADLLDLDPAFVVACIHAERAKNEAEKKLWERIAARMSIAAALVGIMSLPFVSLGDGNTQAAVSTSFDNTIHYAHGAGVLAFVIIALLLFLTNRNNDAQPH